jgi:hypothetical protein
VYERDRTKVRIKLEVIWIFSNFFSGKTACTNNYIQSKYDCVKKVGIYYAVLAGHRNVLLSLMKSRSLISTSNFQLNMVSSVSFLKMFASPPSYKKPS